MTLAIFVTTLVWILWREANAAYKKRYKHRAWYYNRYLTSPHWKFVRWLKRLFWRRCAHENRACGGPFQVHHKKWAYKWLYWEFLPHVLIFGLQVLCRVHHQKERAK